MIDASRAIIQASIGKADKNGRNHANEERFFEKRDNLFHL
jgi:hypothetical protein